MVDREAQAEQVILVTGGAGYIGSHVVLALRDAGRKVIVVDNLITGRRGAVPPDAPFYEVDVGDSGALDEIFTAHRVGAVMHFAGSIVVPESVADPIKYYKNNTFASLTLLDACVRHRVGHFIFSSTAAVYGVPTVSEVAEDAPTAPISPYGSSKLMTEQMIADVERAHSWFSSVRLRYFNVAGADPLGRTGQAGPESTHLIRVALDTAIGRRSLMEIFGDDYPTRDGTCERDFIHVTDLAAAHLQALVYLEGGGAGDAFNCGYGRGITVREVVAGVENLMGRPLPVRMADRREGDPPRVISDPSKLRRALAWSPKHQSLAEILSTALAWQRKLNEKP